MAFVKGDSRINREGRPKGSVQDRMVAINIIMAIMKKRGEKFHKEMSALADKNIVAYYLKFVKDLQPKQIELDATIQHQIASVDDYIQKTLEVRAQHKSMEPKKLKPAEKPNDNNPSK